ncbi:MAG: tetratricopeptide repeat protein [Thermodesulfobacteriota bacterium]
MAKSRTGIASAAILVIVFGSWEFFRLPPTIAQEIEHISAASGTGYTGSVSCRRCHEKFYQLWAPSHHGLAMQPFTAELARGRLIPHTEDIVIGDYRYRADIAGDIGLITEQGPEGEKKYRIDHAMGGKNVYYFLTSIDRGRLQTLPLAYDVKKKEWFDMAGSGVRHFPGRTDEPVHWRDWQYTFNTACYGCHVSQVSTNYDLKTDTYHTVWKEPGINCETCHGPADEHIRVCDAAPKGTVPKDLKITRGGRDFSKEQNNATCSSCHAKAVVLTDSFKPGDGFFDHFDLATFESPDYYPDGRDLGENYTYTSWRMSPCVKSGKLDCLHCHTSSGRYKFKAEEKANQVCMPCHQDKVENPPQHTRHQADSPGNKCISCHMPMTDFARMRRSDHSMLPPAPAATIAFKSPNACNLCHKDKTPQWADETVREWRMRDYQASVLQRAALIAAARNRDWARLPEMLDYVTSNSRDEVFAASLIRLVRFSGDPRVAPVLFKATKDTSPLVRAAAAEALQSVPSQESAKALVEATGDEFRLVRVRAASSLTGFRDLPLADANKKQVEAANKEYMASILSRPDQWESHYNLGNYYLDRGDFKQAVASYETALTKEPRAVLAMVNEAMAYARMGDNRKASEALRNALKESPENAAANFNMGLLKAEMNDLVSAEKHLRAALKADPQMAQAAYNLCLILSRDRVEEAVGFCKKATEHCPDQPRYAYTLAFFRHQQGDLPEAARVLDGLITKYPAYADAYLLLGGICEQQGRRSEAEGIYRKGLAAKDIPKRYKGLMEKRLELLRLGAPDPGKK